MYVNTKHNISKYYTFEKLNEYFTDNYFDTILGSETILSNSFFEKRTKKDRRMIITD